MSAFIERAGYLDACPTRSAREAPATSRQHVRATRRGASSCRDGRRGKRQRRADSTYERPAGERVRVETVGEGGASDEPTARTSDPQGSEFVSRHRYPEIDGALATSARNSSLDLNVFIRSISNSRPAPVLPPP